MGAPARCLPADVAAPQADPLQRGAPAALGLTCGPDGPALAGAPLLRKTATGLTPLPEGELAALTLADLPLAQSAAVHLQLPDVTAKETARLAAVADYLNARPWLAPRRMVNLWRGGYDSVGVTGQAIERWRAAS